MFKYVFVALGIVVTALLIQIYVLYGHKLYESFGEDKSKINVEDNLKRTSFSEQLAESLKKKFTCENYKEKCKSGSVIIQNEKDKEVVIEACMEQIRSTLQCD